MNKLFIFLIFLLPTSGFSQYKFRAITYNVWGLPSPIKLNHKNLKKIAKTIPIYNADIIGFQETFTRKASVLAALPGYHYVAFGPLKGKGKLTNSGLLTVSKYPIKRVKRLRFKKCSGFDCMAAKGVLLTTIVVPNVGEIDVYNTHLNAGKSRKVKWSQIKQLDHFINTHSKANLVVLLGDFNITPNTDFHLYLSDDMSLIDTHAEYIKNFQNLTPKEYEGHTYVKKRPFKKSFSKRRLDYIFYKNSPHRELNFSNKKIIYDNSHDENQYSDHYSVLVDFIVF